MRLLEILCKCLSQTAFQIDVPGYVAGAERDSVIVYQYLLLENAYGCRTCPEIYKGNAVVGLILSQHRSCACQRSEINPGNADAQFIEHPGEIGYRSVPADEYLEIAGQLFAGHADNVVLYLLDIVVCRE